MTLQQDLQDVKNYFSARHEKGAEVSQGAKSYVKTPSFDFGQYFPKPSSGVDYSSRSSFTFTSSSRRALFSFSSSSRRLTIFSTSVMLLPLPAYLDSMLPSSQKCASMIASISGLNRAASAWGHRPMRPFLPYFLSLLKATPPGVPR